MYVCNCNLKVHPTPTPSKNIFEFKHTNARTPIPTYRLLVQNKPTRHGSIIYSIQIKINPESCVVAIVVYLNSIYMRVQLQSCHIVLSTCTKQVTTPTNSTTHSCHQRTCGCSSKANTISSHTLHQNQNQSGAMCCRDCSVFEQHIT